ncbi:TetR/AcrR family transcriptional regulator [Streptomyces sp. NPDC057621]|uniref:TetR/AcrR family transcriptional regulator n=1 Tax=Streptomyces sp. NPDC057621 TaxID=3346186 RepID=UPI0036C2BB5C
MTKPEKPSTRRRGAALEEAILDAAWVQLAEAGYSGFTIEGVAARARTSTPVLYRRWPSREDLLRAAVRRRGDKYPLHTPDTGGLRGDVVALLTEMNERRAGAVALISAQLGSYYAQTGATPGDLRQELIGDRLSPMRSIIEHAVERGEVDPARLTARVVSLPFDLFAQEMLMTLQPLTARAIAEIVDDVFLPLVCRAASPPASTVPSRSVPASP